MHIIYNQNKRILINDANQELDISDGSIIQYTGIYYTPEKEIETQFIGKIETSRANSKETTGIYIVPLYLWNNNTFEWLKIDNYQPPKNKYFLYPHLLMLPNIVYHCHPLYFLHTCQSANFNDYEKITKTTSLHYFS